MMSSPLVVLTGPMGVGKSTIGQLLAKRLGVGYRDTDDDIAMAEGRPIAEIFRDQGEVYFRAVEAQAVRAALAEHEGVLALGGGSILDSATRELLVGLPVVFLDVSAGEALKRLHLDAPRPLLIGNPCQGWRELMEARRPLYTSVACAVVSTDGQTLNQVADVVLGASSASSKRSPSQAAFTRMQLMPR